MIQTIFVTALLCYAVGTEAGSESVFKNLQCFEMDFFQVRVLRQV